MANILLADDDTELCEMLKEYLAAEGFKLTTAYDGMTALSKALAGAFDLIILDIMMPGKNGFDVLRELRTHGGSAPVLMLTARGEDVDSVLGLELGADDYLAKPCSPRVLVARIRALLRRASSRGGERGLGGTETLRLGDLQLRTGTRTVFCQDITVDMTSTEFSVLETLVREAGRVVSKAILSERALDRKLTRYDRSLDMHVSNVRKKLGPLPDGRDRIVTVRGVGYQYVVE